MEECYIIAEIGSNCFKYQSQEKNLQLAKEQILAAKACGADAVKFQLFTYKELYGVNPPATYQPNYELPRSWVPTLKNFCNNYKINFLCSAFSLDGFKFLDPHINTHKIASPEAADIMLVTAVQNLGNPIFLSNGCLTYNEQFELLGSDLWGSEDVLLECVSEYPASSYSYSFDSILKLSQAFSTWWGLSDHTKGYWAAMQARSLGARVFEKHVDLVAVSAPKTPDSCVSMGKIEFENYCKRLKRYKRSSYDKQKTAAKLRYGRQGSGFRPLAH